MEGVPGFRTFEHGYILRFAEKQFKELGFNRIRYLSTDPVFRFGETEDADDGAKTKHLTRLFSGVLKRPDAVDEEGNKNWKTFESNLKELARKLFIHTHGVVANRGVLLIAEKE